MTTLYGRSIDFSFRSSSDNSFSFSVALGCLSIILQPQIAALALCFRLNLRLVIILLRKGWDALCDEEDCHFLLEYYFIVRICVLRY